MVGMYILYFLLLWLFGFIIASVFIMFLLCCMFSEGLDIKIWKRIIYAVVLPFLIYYAFQVQLGLRFSRGIIYTLRIF